jgi:two-component system, NtrC family, response regulator AtoC
VTNSRILAVDDEEPIRGLLKHYLSPTYDLVITSSAEEALEALRGHPFQVVITDIGLPGQSGFDLCASVVKNHPDTVVMMITGLFDAQYAKRAMDAGVFSFLTKPIDFKRLKAVLDDALKHNAARVARRAKRER